VNTKDRIAYLSKDTAFGILTRPALELVLSEHPYERGTIYVLDLTAIHCLNEDLGYRAVNEKLWQIFYAIQTKFPKLIVGRIFSGDEIAIIDPDDSPRIIKSITVIFASEGIAFRHIKDTVRLGMTPHYYKELMDSWTTVLNHKHRYQTL
jgi:hypothetical protein